MTAVFTQQDLHQMAEMGLSPEEAARHVELFRHPPPFTHVLRPCRPGDGIRQLTEAERPGLLARFDEAARRGQTGKFVPASGAATRMFKELLAFLSSPAGEGAMPAEVRTFFDDLPRFAFYEDLAAAMEARGLSLTQAVRDGDYRAVLSCLLEDSGLGYAQLPKALLLFHRYPGESPGKYPGGARTAFEEHLVEAAAINRSRDGVCLLHFTVSPDHLEKFERLLDRVRPKLEERYDCRFEISFSFQERATDTLAVDPRNQPFRLEEGSLLFRPSGHGAVIGNLNALGRKGWDVVLLKNIDNVVPDDRKLQVLLWKRLLGGCLLAVRETAFRHLGRLETLEDDGAEAAIWEAGEFLEKELSRPLPAGFHATGSWRQRRDLLVGALDRPLRVCGVVRNQGEPGGGPFWVESSSGGISPQIVEASQIDRNSREQQEAVRGSTHFNPVDLVLGLRNRHGQPYDLDRYVDPATVFISEKSHEGRPLKALERPGLWNGAMAGWNTVFVEIPDETFAPVKTVLDLLRPEHQ